MTKGTTALRARSGEPSRDIYTEVTAKIIAELEEGRLPWVQPWGRTAASTRAFPATR